MINERCYREKGQAPTGIGSPGNDSRAKLQAAIISRSSVAFDILQAENVSLYGSRCRKKTTH